MLFLLPYETEIVKLHVLIFDEMITGFRWHMQGAQHLYGVKPDLCTFGKAMANGYSVSCVAGKREIMELGAIEFEGRERTFLLSTTHGAEMCGLGAFVATMNFMERQKVVEYLWDYGAKLIEMMNKAAAAEGLSAHFKAGGVACSPHYSTYDAVGQTSLPLRTLFAQEMIRHSVMMPWIALSYRHGDAEFGATQRAVEMSLVTLRRALSEGIDKYLEGPVIKPVFRKFN